MTTKRRLPKLSDREVVLLYREWSEDNYAAGFMALPNDGALPLAFVNAVFSAHLTWTPYEQDLINRWRKAEEEHP